MPRYGYGGIKRSVGVAVGCGEGGAGRANQSASQLPGLARVVAVDSSARESPFTVEKNCRYDCLCKLFKISGLRPLPVFCGRRSATGPDGASSRTTNKDI